MTKYKCGHETSGLIVMDDNIMSMASYLMWTEEGNLETRKECFDCFLKELDAESQKSEVKE